MLGLVALREASNVVGVRVALLCRFALSFCLSVVCVIHIVVNYCQLALHWPRQLFRVRLRMFI
jgi:hypothetical protein